MSTAVATVAAAVPALAMSEEELCSVLQSSLYPGAALPSIKMVIGYCRAAGLDPMQKPVHLVPMSVKKPGTNEYEWRDVVMPGVGLYRTQAARSGCYAGVSEPEFGPTQVLKVGEFSLEYPEWCRVTVRRFNPATGQIFDFSAVEFWLENYATASKDSKAPNAMWKRRPRGQLAKCAEAQALRKAFPEIGSAPTADEMEGRDLDFIDAPAPAPAPAGPAMPKSKKEAAAAKPSPAPAAPAEVIDAATGEVIRQAAPAPAPAPAAAAAASEDDPLVGAGELAFLRRKAETSGQDLAQLAAGAGVNLEALTKSGFATLKSKLAGQA